MIGAVVNEVLGEVEKAANEGINATNEGMMKATDGGISADCDYRDAETGLLVCGQCNTRKQTRLSFFGEERVVACLCRCASERLEEERARHEAEENLMRIRQMKSAGLQDGAFYHYTFEKCDASQENAVYARRYVDNFAEMSLAGQGLLFWGNVGTGKTFLAGCIANALLERKIPVLMTSFPKHHIRYIGVTDGVDTGKDDDLIAFRSVFNEILLKGHREEGTLVLRHQGEEGQVHRMPCAVRLHEVAGGQEFPDTRRGHRMDCAKDFRVGCRGARHELDKAQA